MADETGRAGFAAVEGYGLPSTQCAVNEMLAEHALAGAVLALYQGQRTPGNSSAHLLVDLCFSSTDGQIFSGIVKQLSYGQATSPVPMIGKKSLIRWWSVI